MAKSKRKTASAAGFAFIANRGKIDVDTVCSDRASVEFIAEDKINKGMGRCRRVIITAERKRKVAQ